MAVITLALKPLLKINLYSLNSNVTIKGKKLLLLLLLDEIFLQFAYMFMSNYLN